MDTFLNGGNEHWTIVKHQQVHMSKVSRILKNIKKLPDRKSLIFFLSMSLMSKVIRLGLYCELSAFSAVTIACKRNFVIKRKKRSKFFERYHKCTRHFVRAFLT